MKKLINTLLFENARTKALQMHVIFLDKVLAQQTEQQGWMELALSQSKPKK